MKTRLAGAGGPARIAIVFLVTRAALVLATFVPWPLPHCLEYEVRGRDGSPVTTVTVPWFKDASGNPVALPFDVPRWLDSFARWDSLHYLTIAAAGYGGATSGGAPPQASGFFPGYPLAVRGATNAFNGLRDRAGASPFETPVAGLVCAFAVSNAALLLAALALFRLARTFLDEDAARRSAIWLLVWPSAFFGSAYFAESLFLWFSIEATIAALARRPLLAALLGAAAAFTRFVGTLLVVPLLLAALPSRPAPGRFVRDALLLVLVPAGAGAVFLWHGRTLGDPWAYFEVQSAYGHGGFPSIAGLIDLFRVAGKDPVALARDGVQVAALAAAVACLVPLCRPSRVPVPLAAFAFVSIVVFALADHLLSLPRYLWATFPLAIGAALLVPSRRWSAWLQGASAAAQVAGFVVFTRWWPVLV